MRNVHLTPIELTCLILPVTSFPRAPLPLCSIESIPALNSRGGGDQSGWGAVTIPAAGARSEAAGGPGHTACRAGHT
jgi:hypothetical protein